MYVPDMLTDNGAKQISQLTGKNVVKIFILHEKKVHILNHSL